MNRAAYWVVLMALTVPLSQVIHVADADAQRSRERAARQAAQQSEQAEVRYPDATREDRSGRPSQRFYRQISGAFDDLNEERFDRARSTLAGLEGNERLNDYERALVYQGLAQLAYEEDDVDNAIAYWNRAIETDALSNNDHFQLMYQIAQLEMSEERYEDALKTLDAWFEGTGARTSDQIGLRGNILYRMERYPEAIQTLEQAIAATDTPHSSLYELIMASYYEMDDYPGAVRALEQLIQREPNEIKHQINLAQTYIQMDETSKAIDILRSARSRNLLTESTHWRQLYQLLGYAEESQEAAQVIREGIQGGFLQEDAATLSALGENLYFADQIDEAIVAYGRAAALSSDGNADQQRAHLLKDEERYAEAREAINAAFAKGGLRNPGLAYLIQGEVELELGNRNAARAAFQKATEHDTSRHNAQIWLRNL